MQSVCSQSLVSHQNEIGKYQKTVSQRAWPTWDPLLRHSVRFCHTQTQKLQASLVNTSSWSLLISFTEWVRTKPLPRTILWI